MFVPLCITRLFHQKKSSDVTLFISEKKQTNYNSSLMIKKEILAQSVERTALNRVVEGSIPSDRDSFFLFLRNKKLMNSSERHVSLVDKVIIDTKTNVFKRAVAIGDADNDPYKVFFFLFSSLSLALFHFFFFRTTNLS